MEAENFVICLIGAMDRLWFHQIILFSEPSLLHPPEITKLALPTIESLDNSSKYSSQMSVISKQETSPVDTCPQDETSNQQKSGDRPTRLNHVSPIISAQKQSRNFTYSNYTRLQKTMSCKSLIELELEEVKGFMDLGFIFRKENLSKRMMNLIPGLQRLDARENEENGTWVDFEFTNNDCDDYEDEDKKGIIMRPYLSEAWVLKIPDCLLTNLRMRKRVSNIGDVKKHLKCWARTVASTVQQES